MLGLTLPTLSNIANEGSKIAQDKCKKCGECCKEKALLKDGIITLWTCKYLDENNLCKIYNQRNFMKPKWCHTIKELRLANRLNTLPKNCPYYQGGS